MQTLTILFALAIVAIAIENFTAEFLRVENSDADAKGHPEIQSRSSQMKYYVRGQTGKEKVTITDGDETKEHILDQEKELVAKNPKIIIDYTNDECCKPDRNVIFTSDYPHTISTANNTFTQSYQSNWNCSTCPHNRMPNTKKRMDLRSRVDMYDRCGLARNTTDDFCDNCRILEVGTGDQNDHWFCQPGKYTIDFQPKGQCKGVTFGGCEWPRFEATYKLEDVQTCNRQCRLRSSCNFYRYNSHTQNCSLLNKQDRAQYCSIRAAPREKKDTPCLNVENDQKCDYLLQEECEYDGELVMDYPEGEIASSDSCQLSCQDFPDCQYWIYNIAKSVCILRNSDKKTCNFVGGPKEPAFDDCQASSPNEKR